jgi:endonuclease/exonuclease/phosphatase family metal-dependent hydrolase
MPYYGDLNPQGHLDPAWEGDEAGRQRTIARLLALRQAFGTDEGAPPPRSLGSLLIGTWNLREFDSAKWGVRVPESYAYIAEIVDRFDLVAIQEVRADLLALEQLGRRLGHHWSYLVSDTTEGAAGNQELAFLYDTRKVRFLGIAGELVLPPEGTDKPATQVARTPLMAAFQVGWTKFVLTTVHIIYGADTAEPVARVEEIRQVARFLRARTEDPNEPIHNFILLGDFNIFSTSDTTLRALTEDGDFTIPEAILDATKIPGTNVAGDKKFDQIAYRAREGRFEATGKSGRLRLLPLRLHRPRMNPSTAPTSTPTSRPSRRPGRRARSPRPAPRPARASSTTGGPSRCPTTLRCGRSSGSISRTST